MNRLTSSRSSSVGRCAASSTWWPPSPESKGSGTQVVIGGGQGGGVVRRWTAVFEDVVWGGNCQQTGCFAELLDETFRSVEKPFPAASLVQVLVAPRPLSLKVRSVAFRWLSDNFLRNDALDRKDSSKAKKGVDPAEQFGASFGGPVQLGRLTTGKNRTFRPFTKVS